MVHALSSHAAAGVRARGDRWLPRVARPSEPPARPNPGSHRPHDPSLSLCVQANVGEEESEDAEIVRRTPGCGANSNRVLRTVFEPRFEPTRPDTRTVSPRPEPVRLAIG
eukprot:6358478-Prymnesium_polylepis.1